MQVVLLYRFQGHFGSQDLPDYDQSLHQNFPHIEVCLHLLVNGV